MDLDYLSTGLAYFDLWSVQYGTGDANFDLIVIAGLLLVILSLIGAPAQAVNRQADSAGELTRKKLADKESEQSSDRVVALAPAAVGTKDRLLLQMKRSRSTFWSRIRDTFVGGDKVSSESLEVLESALLASDMGPVATMQLMEAVELEANNSESSFSVDSLQGVLEREIVKILDQPAALSDLNSPGLKVVLIVGVNGAGKTTTVAKLANRFRKNDRKVMLIAADTFRAAAMEQLEHWGERAQVTVFRGPEGCKPAGVVYDGLKEALQENYDVAIIDTAGRLHTKSNLMQELTGISNAVRKLIPTGAHERWLVLDGTSGQNGLMQARQFHESVSLTGVIVTKLDGTSKGGVVVSVVSELGIPVKYIGVGEGPEDLQEFNAAGFANALFALDEVQDISSKKSEHGSKRVRNRIAS
jgi:fused signal recognition particle receptor